MKDLGPRNILRIPLQLLWEFPNMRQKIQVDALELEQEFIAWYAQYEPEVQHMLYQQISLAILDSNYDYTQVLKNVKCSNEDILFYFRFLRDVIKKNFQTAA
jgi:hypothetical protein